MAARSGAVHSYFHMGTGNEIWCPPSGAYKLRSLLKARLQVCILSEKIDRKTKNLCILTKTQQKSLLNNQALRPGHSAGLQSLFILPMLSRKLQD